MDTKKEEWVVGLIIGVVVVGVVLYVGGNATGGSGYQVIAPSDAVTTAALSAQSAADSANASLSAVQSNNATTAFTDYINQSDALSSALASTQLVQVSRS